MFDFYEITGRLFIGLYSRKYWEKKMEYDPYYREKTRSTEWKRAQRAVDLMLERARNTVTQNNGNEIIKTVTSTLKFCIRNERHELATVIVNYDTESGVFYFYFGRDAMLVKGGEVKNKSIIREVQFDSLIGRIYEHLKGGRF